MNMVIVLANILCDKFLIREEIVFVLVGPLCLESCFYILQTLFTLGWHCLLTIQIRHGQNVFRLLILVKISHCCIFIRILETQKQTFGIFFLYIFGIFFVHAHFCLLNE